MNQQQQNQRFRMDSSLSHQEGGGLKCILLVPKPSPYIIVRDPEIQKSEDSGQKLAGF